MFLLVRLHISVLEHHANAEQIKTLTIKADAEQSETPDERLVRCLPLDANLSRSRIIGHV